MNNARGRFILYLGMLRVVYKINIQGYLKNADGETADGVHVFLKKSGS